MSEVNNKAKLASKLVRVMASIKNVAKNGQNDFQNYSYVTERDVVDAVRAGLIAENIIMLSSVEGSHKEGDLTSVMMKHTFLDGDTGETVEVKSLGTGSDRSDKGAYKAYTGAIKYMLQKCFLIPLGEDPEGSDETGKPTGSSKTTGSAKPTLATVAASTKKPGFGKTPIAASAVVKVEEEESEF